MLADNQLKPCPFCGEAARMIDGHAYGWDIGCPNSKCEVQPSVNRRIHQQAEAVAAWNRRSDPNA